MNFWSWPRNAIFFFWKCRLLHGNYKTLDCFLGENQAIREALQKGLDEMLHWSPEAICKKNSTKKSLWSMIGQKTLPALLLVLQINYKFYKKRRNQILHFCQKKLKMPFLSGLSKKLKDWFSGLPKGRNQNKRPLFDFCYKKFLKGAFEMRAIRLVIITSKHLLNSDPEIVPIWFWAN